jgi:beta-aspartyl-peptidase (threonine type)
MPIALVVHGGAGSIAAERVEPANEGCRIAAQLGWSILQRGGSALDAVEAVVRALEDDPNYNAGTGSCLNSDGFIEMDASIMEGHTLHVGAVACVERIKHPVTLARRVLESPHALLVGAGAREFALEHGITLCLPSDLLTERQHNNWLRIREKERENEPIFHRRQIGSISAPQDEYDEPEIHRREVDSIPARVETQETGIGPKGTQKGKHQSNDEKHGTVGAVALDAQGHLATATSTGGFTNKHPGRIGDTPLIGCGFYADENAAISCTGYGEDFIRLMLAKRAADFVAKGMNAREAAEAAIALLGAKAEGTGGLIVVDRFGNVGFSWNSNNMAYAYMQEM